ncbi:acetoacetyl-CoA synthetase-like [Argiope bruennichi]|uniref:acetoacetyl-CoA synthetase-like n=1 Tax=Argiope bruennichi TaxID=94029 RepID=UPI002494B448|nr:acetoacetyl-CoA synthetase-like [Argiope bruennichi]
MNVKNFSEVPVMWQPDPGNGKIMQKFKNIIKEKYHVKIDNYWEFHQWSINHIQELWAELWDYSGIIYSKKFNKVVDLNIPLEDSPSWFEGAAANLAENLLKYRDDKIAFVLAGEDKETEHLTRAQLYEESKLYAAAFRKFGLKKGDVVVCQMSNRKEAIIAMIAVVSIGAIWTGALPLLGAKAVLNRFKQVEPKIYLTIDSIPHERKRIDMLPKIKEITEGLPTLTKVIIVPSKEDSHSKNISDIKNSCFLDEFLQLGTEKDGSVPPMKFEQVDFTHPVFIIYTSGTTGLPKAIVHGTGFILAIFRDFSMHLDGGEDSVWFSSSPVGWVSWNCYACLLFFGARIVLFEGSAFFLSPTHFWDLIDEHKMTHLFIPTSVLDEYQKRGYIPTKNHSLDSLKVFLVGGTVAKPQIYDFVYEKVKKNVLFASSFGSTETIGSGFIADVTLPVHKGEIPAFSLGVSVETVDDNGKPVFGEMGEIVITKPIPNLALGLWKDKDNSLYREKYFSKYPGKFATNDYGIINPFTKGLIICCRSDETLKQRGCRFGSSEIYNVVDTFPEVRDSLCVSQYNEKMDERAVLFLKIREGYSFSDELVSKIREAIARELTIRHVPDVILEIKDIPYNINGKKLEIIVKKIINNRPYNAENINNTESLKYYQNIPQLQGF